jgi:hypothetical protein
MTARVALAEEGPDTLLRYEAQAEIGGKLATVGSRLVQSVARKNADEFFTAFAGRLGGSAVAPPVPAPAPAVAGPVAPSARVQPPRIGLPLWVVALIAGGCGVVLGFVLGRL